MDRKEKSAKNKNRFSFLLSSIRKESIEEVKEILEKWTNLLNLKDKNGRSALHYCTEHSSALCADMILKKSPQLLTAQDNEGYTALHLSVIVGNQTMTRFLISISDINYLDCCDNEMHTAIHWATVCAELECLDLLMNAGANPSTADIHGAFPIHYAAQMCSPHSGICIGNDSKIGLSVLNRLLQSPNVDVNCVDSDGRSPLLWAASVGSGDALLAIINAGALISSHDKDGLTALHCASSRGHVDCLETLVTLCGMDINQMDANGCTPLFYAVTLGHADCTRFLIQSGADVNHQDFKKRTAAHCGAAKGQIETIKILGQHGANLWLRNIRGDLPLHEAVKSGRKELVKWLLEQMPTAVNATNTFGRSSLHIAAINNNIEMAKILIDVGADVNTVMKLKGHFVTPLDAALQRGYRGVGKYLLLHGALPASRISQNLNKSLIHRSTQQIDSFTTFENTSPVDSLDDFKARTESSESGLQSHSQSTSFENTKINLPKLPTLATNNDQIHETRSSTASSILENGNHVKSVREFETQLSERPSHLKQAIITNVYVTNTPICHSKRVPPLKKVKKKRKSLSEHEDSKVLKVYTPSISSSSSQLNGEDNSVKVVLEFDDTSNYKNKSNTKKLISTSVKEFKTHNVDIESERIVAQEADDMVHESKGLISKDANNNNEIKDSKIEIISYLLEKGDEIDANESESKFIETEFDEKSGNNLIKIHAQKSNDYPISYEQNINEEIDKGIDEKLIKRHDDKKITETESQLNSESVHSSELEKLEKSEENIDKKTILRKKFFDKADQFMKNIEETEKSKEKVIEDKSLMKKVMDEYENEEIDNKIDEGIKDMNLIDEQNEVIGQTFTQHEEIDSQRDIDSETYVKSDNESEKSAMSPLKEVDYSIDNSTKVENEGKEIEENLEISPTKYADYERSQEEKEIITNETEENMRNTETFEIQNQNSQIQTYDQIKDELQQIIESKDSQIFSIKELVDEKELAEQKLQEVNNDQNEDKIQINTEIIDEKMKISENNETDKHEMEDRVDLKSEQSFNEEVIRSETDEAVYGLKEKDDLKIIESETKEKENIGSKIKSESKLLSKSKEKVDKTRLEKDKNDNKEKISDKTSKLIDKNSDNKSKKSVTKRNINNSKHKMTSNAKTNLKTQETKTQSKNYSNIEDEEQKTPLRSKTQFSGNDLTLNKIINEETSKFLSEKDDTINSSSHQPIDSRAEDSQNMLLFSSEESIFDTSLMMDDMNSEQMSFAIQSLAETIKSFDDSYRNTSALDPIQQAGKPSEKEELVVEYDGSSPLPQKSESRCSHKLHFKTFPANVGKVEIGHIGHRVDSRLDRRYTKVKSVLEQDLSKHEKEKAIRYRIIRPSSEGYKSMDINLITQTVEKSLRKYQLERKLFEELHDLKRFQIRSGKSNETLMVKRLVDKFRKDGKAPGMTDFEGPYTYKTYELYLYDQLRRLSTSNQGKVALITRSASYENMQLITPSNENITCSNPEITRTDSSQEYLHIEQIGTVQNQQLNDQNIEIKDHECVAQTKSNAKVDIKSQKETNLEKDGKSEIITSKEEIISDESEKPFNEFGNNKIIDLNNLYNEKELDYTKFNRKPIEEKVSISVREQELNSSLKKIRSNEEIFEIHINEKDMKSDSKNIENNKLSNQQIDSENFLTNEQNKETLKENVEKEWTESHKHENDMILSITIIEDIPTDPLKQKVKSVNKKIEAYLQNDEINKNNLILKQVTKSGEAQKSKSKLRKKSYDSQTSVEKSTNGSIKSRKSDTTDKRSTFSGYSSRKSAISSKSNISSAYNHRRDSNKTINEKRSFKKEFLKPVTDREPLESAKNRPKFKRTKMTIPPKQEIHISLESINKRWTHIKEAEKRKLYILRKYKSNPDLSYDFTLWFELNKSHRKSFNNKLSLNDLNYGQTDSCLKRTLSDSALLEYQSNRFVKQINF